MRWVSLSEWISACQWRLPQLFCWYVVNPPWDGWLIRICHFQISTVTTVVCTNKSTGWTANVLCRTRHNRTAVSVVLSYAHETHAVVEGFSARNRKWFGSLHWTTKWQVGQILLLPLCSPDWPPASVYSHDIESEFLYTYLYRGTSISCLPRFVPMCKLLRGSWATERSRTYRSPYLSRWRMSMKLNWTNTQSQQLIKSANSVMCFVRIFICASFY